MIKTINDLGNVLQTYVEKALKVTEDTIFEIVSDKIIEYYNEPVFDNELDPTEPVFYNRTGKMLEELTASHIKKTGNTYSFTVGYPDSYLTFRYSGGFIKNSDKSFNRATGLQVLTWMNDSSHGGTVEGEHNYWNEAIEEINNKYGSITNLFIQNCKKVGIPIN